MESFGISRVEIPSSEFIYNCYVKKSEQNEGYIVCHHGVGSSAATFTLFAKALLELNPKLGFIAYDLRHHGQTVETSPNLTQKNSLITDLDLNTLCSNLDWLIGKVFVSFGETQKPPICLVGHSMGGSVVCKFANTYNANYNIRGLVVIDAVEGYATKSLSSMPMLLGMWPDKFDSIDQAIKWFVYDGAQIRSKESAKISVPPLLVYDNEQNAYVWKLDLKRTRPNWDTWFKDLDEMFVNAKCARMLILSGVSKLDTYLTRAQMQGKFQMCLVSEAGHYIQEDTPIKVAMAVHDFWERNSVAMRIVPKFGKFRDD